MHVFRLLRVLLPLVILAVVVGGAVSVLKARPDLQHAEHAVQTAWSPLETELTTRYDTLSKADDALRDLPGPVGDLARTLHTALLRWQAARGNAPAGVDAANALEALGRRLVTAARTSDRTRNDPAVVELLDRYAADTTIATSGPGSAAGAFNHAVAAYEHQRRGPVRAVVARLLGDDNIAAFAPAPVATQA